MKSQYLVFLGEPMENIPAKVRPFYKIAINFIDGMCQYRYFLMPLYWFKIVLFILNIYLLEKQSDRERREKWDLLSAGSLLEWMQLQRDVSQARGIQTSYVYDRPTGQVFGSSPYFPVCIHRELGLQ